MKRHIIIRLAYVLSVLAAAPAAYAATVTLGTVRITQPVLADGKPLPPGLYEVRLTDEVLPPNVGQSSGAERVVEFVKDGQVVGRDAAEVMAGEDDSVGTSGRAASAAKPRVELLKGRDFVRISTTREGMRFLIYLPVVP
jgi:hypothetical protein